MQHTKFFSNFHFYADLELHVLKLGVSPSLNIAQPRRHDIY